MAEDIFPTRFRGYDREAVDQAVYELRTVLAQVSAERDRAANRAVTLEHDGTQASATASATVQWLIDSAEQEAQHIRAEARQAAAAHVERAEELLRHRIELVEQAQHEADVCRAQAAEEARQVVHDALEKADTLLRGLRESDAALQELFGGGTLVYRMPPPRHAMEQQRAQVVDDEPRAPYDAPSVPQQTPAPEFTQEPAAQVAPPQA